MLFVDFTSATEGMCVSARGASRSFNSLCETCNNIFKSYFMSSDSVPKLFDFTKENSDEDLENENNEELDNFLKGFVLKEVH